MDVQTVWVAFGPWAWDGLAGACFGAAEAPAGVHAAAVATRSAPSTVRHPPTPCRWTRCSRRWPLSRLATAAPRDRQHTLRDCSVGCAPEKKARGRQHPCRTSVFTP